MNVYLVPLIPQSQTIAGRSIQISAPKYLALVGQSFMSLPYEGISIVSLAAPNTALEAEPDVYAFPSNFSALMTSADVAALSTFLTAVNVPTSQIVTGLTFAEALQIIAKIFLVDQFLRGISGAPIFSQGITISTAVEDSDIAPIAATTPIPGPFDFSNVKSTDSLGTVLDSLSKQITQPVNFGGLS
jgi:hypothetical protein